MTDKTSSIPSVTHERTHNYDSHYVNDRLSGMRQKVENGDVRLAVYRLVGYLRRERADRPVSLYEERTEHRVAFAELPDPDTWPDDEEL